MKSYKRDANSKEIEQVNHAFRQRMISADRTALYANIFAVCTVLYALNAHNSFMLFGSLPFFIIAYLHLKKNDPIELERRKFEKGFDVIEYEGTLQIQSYGCCSNKRVAVYIDEYELTNFNPVDSSSQEMQRWTSLNPHGTYKITVAFISGFKPFIFDLREIEKAS